MSGILSILLSLAVLAAGRPFQAEIRTVRVKVLGDEEYRLDSRWAASADDLLRVVSADFEQTFGLRFLPIAHDEWISDDRKQSLEALAEELDARMDKGDADVVVAITAQKNLAAGYSGFAQFREALILIRAAPDRDELARTLIHEFGHLFGAVHVDDPASVMGQFIQTRGFDALNLRAVRLNRDRSFHTVDFPVPKGRRPEAIALYELLCGDILAGKPAQKSREAPRSRITGLVGDDGGRDRSELDDAFVLLAHLTLEAKDYERTLAVCRQALALNPDNLETENLIGIALRRMGRVDEALDKYRSILAQKPGHARVHYNMGIALAKKGDLEAARLSYETALGLKPNFAEAHNNLGEVFLKSGRFEDAEKEMRRAIAILDGYALAHSNLAEVLCRKMDYATALIEAERSIVLDPDIADAYNVRGNIHRQMGLADDAARDYERALKLDPAYEKAHYNLGITWLDAGKEAEAKRSFRKAVEINPNFAEARAGVGFCLLRENKAEEAVVEILKAHDLGHRSAKTYLNLSTAYLRLGRIDEALAGARDAVELEPGLALAHNNLGLALLRKGEAASAVRELERAVELEPASREANLNLGSLYLQAQRLDDALRAYGRLAALDPPEGLVLNNLAVIHFRKRQFALAKEYADRALAAGFKVHPDFLAELEKKIK